MSVKQSTKERIIQAADELIYKNGFEYTSFKDISEIVNISRGNFYHHFKSKDEILEAVIESRKSRTLNMLLEWDSKTESSLDSIKCFINILITNKEKIMSYGCPVGSLVTELSKLGHVSQMKANKIFTLFRDWLVKHLVNLDLTKKNAERVAMHLLVRSQGVATMYNAFHDEKFLKSEVKQIHDWLDGEIN